MHLISFLQSKAAAASHIVQRLGWQIHQLSLERFVNSRGLFACSKSIKAIKMMSETIYIK